MIANNEQLTNIKGELSKENLVLVNGTEVYSELNDETGDIEVVLIKNNTLLILDKVTLEKIESADKEEKIEGINAVNITKLNGNSVVLKDITEDEGEEESEVTKEELVRLKQFC